jgi:hypothetical protein
MTRADRLRVTERQEQANIVRLLRTVGAAVYIIGTTRRRDDYHGTMQTPGLPDLLCFVPRRDGAAGRIVVCVEVKAAGGRLRPEQQIFRELCEGTALVHLVGGQDVVAAWLRELRVLR